jgi:hypothetical protein
MTNQEFLLAIEKSFGEFIVSGTSRSTKKLVPLHGAIANDMHERLGEAYEIKAQGFALGKEGTINGRYMDKKVDILVSRAERAIGGIAVKFVMQNYSQNANNYFENMLGETANIRSACCPYFQIFIIPDKLPYYTNGGVFKHWETFSDSNIHKYCVLDRDNPQAYFHSPDKMLIYVIHLPDIGNIRTKTEYLSRYAEILERTPQGRLLTLVTAAQFSQSVILNDYELFADKVYHSMMAV